MDDTLREPLPPITAAEFDALAAAPAFAEARFFCVVHDAEAGVVRLLGGPGAWMAASDSFAYLFRERLHEEPAESLLDALREMDVRLVHAGNPKWAPFFCADCERVYCGECWRLRSVEDPDLAGWVIEEYATCPRGHERMLSE